MVCVFITEDLPSRFVWSLQRAYLHGLCGYYRGFTFTVCVAIAEGLPSWFCGYCRGFTFMVCVVIQQISSGREKEESNREQSQHARLVITEDLPSRFVWSLQRAFLLGLWGPAHQQVAAPCAQPVM